MKFFYNEDHPKASPFTMGVQSNLCNLKYIRACLYKDTIVNVLATEDMCRFHKHPESMDLIKKNPDFIRSSSAVRYTRDDTHTHTHTRWYYEQKASACRSLEHCSGSLVHVSFSGILCCGTSLAMCCQELKQVRIQSVTSVILIINNCVRFCFLKAKTN